MNDGIKIYFKAKDLVCPDVYKKWGERAWMFLDPRLIDNLLYIRQGLAKPVIANTWGDGGIYTQRGLRCNCCSLVANKTKAGTLYMSAHMQGMAVDFDVKGMKAEEVRTWIKQHAATLPHPCRLENGTSWVHMDVRVDTSNPEKLQAFNG